jgi:5'-nucleotidase
MPYALDDKLVIAIASSALFDLNDSDLVFRERGVQEYRRFQREHENHVLPPGAAFPLIRRLLNLNGSKEADRVVEVILCRAMTQIRACACSTRFSTINLGSPAQPSSAAVILSGTSRRSMQRCSCPLTHLGAPAAGYAGQTKVVTSEHGPYGGLLELRRVSKGLGELAERQSGRAHSRTRFRSNCESGQCVPLTVRLLQLCVRYSPACPAKRTLPSSLDTTM